jgi:hypothetical protein
MSEILTAIWKNVEIPDNPQKGEKNSCCFETLNLDFNYLKL